MTMKSFVKPLKTERRNGLFTNLGDPSLQQLRRFMTSAGISPADIERCGLRTVESLGVGHLLKDTLDKLQQFFSDVRVLKTETSRIEVSVSELHCPRATGAKAKLSVVRETEEVGDCSIEILGIGGGDEYKTTFSVEDGLETTNGACVAAIYSVLAVFESCELDTPDGQVRRFVRLKRLEPNSESVKGVQLEGTADACQTTDFAALTNVTQEPFDLRGYGAATYQKTLSLARGTKWKGEAKIKLADLGINLGAAYEGSRTHKTELEYSLVGGFDYLAIKPKNERSWLWRVTQ